MAGASAVMTVFARCLVNRRSDAAGSGHTGMGKGRKGESLVTSTRNEIEPLLTSLRTKIATTQVTLNPKHYESILLNRAPKPAQELR